MEFNMSDDMTFENKIARLEEIVEKLESDEVALEEAMKFFEEGTALSKECLKRLKEIETKIEKLVKTGNSDGENKDDYKKEDFIENTNGAVEKEEDKSVDKENNLEYKEKTDEEDELQGTLDI